MIVFIDNVSNPLSHNDAFDYPMNGPDHMDWSKHFLSDDKTPTVLDIGCGFGGLTIALADILPNHNILGLEIRAKVTEYVRLRIAALRKEFKNIKYGNCSVIRSNTMKFMPNLFQKSSIDKLFFCFPDPNFKRKKHARRIISERLLSEYAFFLKTGGKLYCITDVEELHNWHMDKCRSHPLFRELSDEEISADPCVKAMKNETEEGKKVERAGAKKYSAVFERLNNDIPENVSVENFWLEGELGVIKKEQP